MDNDISQPLFCATVLYPNQEAASFDFDLYAKALIPEYAKILGDNCVRFEVRKGLSSPGKPAPEFLCIANIWIKSAEQFGASMATKEMTHLMDKINAFTAIEPVRQFDEVFSSNQVLPGVR